MRLWLLALAACAGPQTFGGPTYPTTSGAIALANLDHEIARRGDEPGVEDLLLERARFLADVDALDRAVELAEARSADRRELLRRARARAAVHRFVDALADLEAAERAGADADEIAPLRASIAIATRHAVGEVPGLEALAGRRPGFASRSALAGAYAAMGGLENADRTYARALAELDTTSPFPYAWIEFARGTMWAERDAARAEMLLRRALDYLPEFVAANLHLAELEAARGDVGSAIARLERFAHTGEPEALGLLGELHVRSGDRELGCLEIAQAHDRYASLLTRHPQAFAAHAAGLYLGPARLCALGPIGGP